MVSYTWYNDGSGRGRRSPRRAAAAAAQRGGKPQPVPPFPREVRSLARRSLCQAPTAAGCPRQRAVTSGVVSAARSAEQERRSANDGEPPRAQPTRATNKHDGETVEQRATAPEARRSESKARKASSAAETKRIERDRGRKDDVRSGKSQGLPKSQVVHVEFIGAARRHSDFMSWSSRQG